MNMHSEPRLPLARAVTLALLLCALAACKKEQSATGADATTAPTAAQQATRSAHATGSAGA